jgi:hypothetical protein
MLFAPKWFEGTILVSEATTKLPTAMMHPYAEGVLKELHPIRHILS